MIFEEAIENVRDRNVLKSRINQFKRDETPNQIDRLADWIRFFNINYSKQLLLYDHLVFSAVWFMSSSEICRNLTVKETERCQEFFRKLYSVILPWKISDEEDADFLFAIALFYGKFPEMKVKSFEEALPKQTL